MKSIIKTIDYGWFIIFLTIGISAIAYGADKKEESPVKVSIKGAPSELADNIRAFLPSLRRLKCDSSERRVERFIDATEEKLAEGAEAMGYFSSAFKVTPSHKDQCWHLNIAVTPGKPVTVNKLNIKLDGDGKKQSQFQTLLKDPPYQKGDVLISQNYEDYKAKLKRIANNLGYFDADLSSHTIRVNVQSHKADIDLAFDTGERYKIGKVTVDQDVLDDEHVQRYLRIKEGDDFDSVALINQQRIIEGGDYYKSVEVQADYTKAKNHRINVHIEAPKRKRYTYKGAMGFGTGDGMYVETGVKTHWVNRKGHKLNISTRYSQHDPAIGLNYKIPLWKPEHEFASISASWNRSDNDDIRGTALKLGFDYHRRNSHNWEQVASVNFLNEETQINGHDAILSQLTMLGLGLNKTERNDTLFPTEGWRLSAGLKAAGEGFLSDQTLLRSDISGKFLHTMDNYDKIILQGEAGGTFIGDFDEMPKSLRYFAGGQNSVRGYGFQSLGETNAELDVIGGRNVLTMSAEYEHPIKDKMSAAVFVDAGNAFNDWGDFDLKFGYGIGARYKSPLGPIRIDFAVPENDPSAIHFYFSLGPDL